LTIRKKIKNDALLILSLLLVFCSLGSAVMLTGEKGDTVTITVDKAPFGEYPLDEDRTIEIRNGDSLNILVIKDGRVFMTSASCPDGICTRHRAISRDGECIICLPNKIVITVSAKNEFTPDAVA
jgi:hypothetical protein